MPTIRIVIAFILGSLAAVEAASTPPAPQNDEVLRQNVIGIWSQKVSISIGNSSRVSQSSKKI